MRKLLLFALLVGLSACGENSDFDEEKFKSALLSYMTTSVKHPYIDSVTRSLQFPHVFRADNNKKDAVDDLICNVCQTVTDVVIIARQGGLSGGTIQGYIEELCIDFGIENQEVCHGIISINVDIFMYIIDNAPELSGRRVCSIFLQSVGCSPSMSGAWEIDIPEGFSAPREQKAEEATFEVVQISDFHYDPRYLVGGNARCTEPICCQNDHPGPETEEDACGYWGDYRDSDAPLRGVTTALDHVSREHNNAEFIYYTGDTVNHRVWSTSTDTNVEQLSLITLTMLSYFNQTPVYPVLGNHEPHPLNVFSPEDVRDDPVTTQWLFDVVADQWSFWLPPEANETIRMGGYYTVLAKPGLRVIGLNTNVCYIYNWWLFYADEDPFGQLKWLVEVLTEAEANNEAVHILSHVEPSNNYCFWRWSQQYRRITERFAGTIRAQFNGHTHADTFSVMYNSSQPNQPISVGFNGGSVTANTKKNPNYKVYQFGEESFDVIDADVWIFNLTEANLNTGSPPEWYKLYSFREHYGVSKMGPEELDWLVQELATNSSLRYDYFKFFKCNAEPTVDNGCDDACYRDLLCTVVNSEVLDSTQCDYISELYENSK